MTITGKTKVYAIFGSPVSHSFSPIIHNAGFKKNNIDAVYVAFEPISIAKAVESIRSLKISGASITIPYKVDIIPYLDQLTPLARNIGAVNTVFWEEDRLVGDNTDGIGALLALKEKTAIQGKKILIIGYGGSARAIAFTLAQEKPHHIAITGRNKEQAHQLAKEIASKTQAYVFYEPLDKIQEYDILIQTTPLGMSGNTELPLAKKDIQEKKIVFDIVYRPKETPLLKQAKQKKCVLVFGYKMLFYQGIKQFEIWTKTPAPLQTMEKALLKVLF